jgi:NhaA family Na+:H+ antiporter
MGQNTIVFFVPINLFSGRGGRRKMQSYIKQFLKLESSGGIVLFIMAIIAMIWANSSFDYIHDQFVLNSLFFINEGLMTVFFLLVGLELKRGFLRGEFSRLSQVSLPLVAALGGMIVPAVIYYMINAGNPITLQGWATPVATDIAFALGVLSLFGKRVPERLKLFLLALAIFDDVGAILIIGVFYSHGIQYIYLFICLLLVAILWGLNRMSVHTLSPYLFIGFCLWLGMEVAGVDPVLAGVTLALMIPDGPLQILEKRLHPFVAFLIMPLFALANAGFSLQGISFSTLGESVVLGIIAGLFIGKQLGVFGVTWLFVRAGWGKLLHGMTWLEIYGVSLVCGIGFTMSLFLGTLSFQHQDMYLDQVRLGVLVGSSLSGITGAYILWLAFRRRQKQE